MTNEERQDTKKIKFQLTLYFVSIIENHAYFTYNRFVTLEYVKYLYYVDLSWHVLDKTSKKVSFFERQCLLGLLSH